MSEYGPSGDQPDFRAPETGQETELQPEQQISETYVNSKILEQKTTQEERGEPFRVAFTDIDNTFFRNDRAEQSRELANLANERSYPIVAVTGNDFAGVMGRIETGELPHFEVIIGSVGTEIWALQADGQTYHQDEFFRKELERGGYNRPEVAQSANDFITTLSSDYPGYALEYQRETEEQHYLATGEDKGVQPFKISFCFFAESPEELQAFSQLASNHFSGQELVISEEIGHNSQLKPGETRKKYNLDILPVTKGGAVEYAASVLDVKQGIVAGDSGNDIDMLLKTKTLNAVVVGGAKTELIEAADRGEGTSFQEVTDNEGSTKAVYVERDQNRLGPDSIRRAAEALLRAERIKNAD